MKKTLLANGWISVPEFSAFVRIPESTLYRYYRYDRDLFNDILRCANERRIRLESK